MDEKAKRLSADVQATKESTVFDLAAQSANTLDQMVAAALSKPLPLLQMVRLSFIVGGGKKVRQKYDEKLPLHFADALKKIGYVEDRGASLALDCQGMFKYQHDTDKDLKFIHVYPKLDTEAAQPSSSDHDNAAMTPAELITFAELATFQKMITSKTPTFAQRRRAHDVLKGARKRLLKVEASLTALQAISDEDQQFYDAIDSAVLQEKQEWLAAQLEAMIDRGALTHTERGSTLTMLAHKLEDLEIKLATAESSGKAKQAAQLQQVRCDLLGRIAKLKETKPITHPIKFEAEMKAIQKKLAALEKLENSKEVLPLEEVTKLNTKPKLLADLQAMQIESTGWFSTD
mmetsp:Transcript_52608/g.87343  ORF Transcript_52608/g.87343 Transcript_52608/m.87343 type:complete len:346 (-) Transcript_52608:400-1437(-)